MKNIIRDIIHILNANITDAQKVLLIRHEIKTNRKPPISQKRFIEKYLGEKPKVKVRSQAKKRRRGRPRKKPLTREQEFERLSKLNVNDEELE